MEVNSTTVRAKELDQRGATTVEATIVLLPLLLIIFVFFQLSCIAFQSVTLQYSLNKAARWGILGYTVESPTEPGTQLARGESISEWFKNEMNIYTSAEEVSIYFCPVSNPSCNSHSNPPGSQQWMIVRAEKPVSAILGFGSGVVQASVLAMNEPF